MSDQPHLITPVLKTAWKHFADFDNTAEYQQDQFLLLRRWVLYFSIFATFLAIILENFRALFARQFVSVLQVILILVPIVGSGIMAYINIFRQGQRYLAMRAGAEEILKDIFLYRTVMQHNPDRNKWLKERLAEIQRQVHRTLGGEVVVKPYTGKNFNPRYYADAKDADLGIDDLDSEEYMRVRLESQLNWHVSRIQKHDKARIRLTIYILIFGGLGALFAGLDMLITGIAVWVALTTAITSAITNWQELMGISVTIPNYSKVILELNILRDHWLSLTPQEKTSTEFYKLVQNTEKVLWSQNVQFISAMQESLDDAEAEQQKILEEMVVMSREAVGRVQEEILEEARRSMDEAAQAATEALTNQLDDGQKLPAGMIYNAALGPVLSILTKDGEDAPDGFKDEAADKPLKSAPEKTPEADQFLETENDDPVLLAINSAVVEAIEETEIAKAKSQEQRTSPDDLINDEAAKPAQEAANEYIRDEAATAAQEAANEYIRDAADAFNNHE